MVDTGIVFEPAVPEPLSRSANPRALLCVNTSKSRNPRASTARTDLDYQDGLVEPRNDIKLEMSDSDIDSQDLATSGHHERNNGALSSVTDGLRCLATVGNQKGFTPFG
jgi:hypothetical protein